MYSTVFFDADGTLIDHKAAEKQALQHLFAEIGLPYKNHYQNVFRPFDAELWANDIIPAEDVPTYRFKLFFELVKVDYSNYSNANELFKIGLASSTALIDGAQGIVEYLHGKGVMLCVITNGLVELQCPRVMNSKIGKFISHIIVSEEVGAHKPNPLIFNTLLNRLGLASTQAIMVGDSLQNDIQGAANAGIKSVWYNPCNVQNKVGIAPTYEISDLLQLKNILFEGE